MPKDLQIGPLSRRNRTILRELSNIRRSIETYSPDLEGHGSPPGVEGMTVPLDPSSDAAAMDTMEASFSALSLDVSTRAEGDELASSGRSTSESGLGASPQTRVPWSAEGPAERSFIIAEPSPYDAPAGRGLTLEQGLKDNALLRRRILALERRERSLKSQVKMHKRAIGTIASEAEGARRLLVLAEEHFQAFERTIEKLRDENHRYCSWWLSENRALKDLLGFVANPDDPYVTSIVSSSRARFVTFYSDAK